MTEAGTAVWVTQLINELWGAAENDMRKPEPEKAWDVPLVGFAAGPDPVWEQYKTVVGPFHWTPREAFAEAFPDLQVAPEELTVVSWILPQTGATKREQRAQTVYPAERWARTRVFGEQFNHQLRLQVAERFTAAGYPAVSPVETPRWGVRDSDAYVYASTWSERHAAYAAGLGTFGLCDGLITPKGKAMRAGSVVVQLALPPTPRPYTDHRAYCLYFSEGTCGECIDRCPAGALSPEGHDKVACKAHLDRSRAHVTEHYGFEGYGCGLCQVGVPCESGIPASRR
jgi:epoxyqueuosine reductase